MDFRSAILVFTAVLNLTPGIISAEDSPKKAFPHKLIFSDTPEIGKKWHGGVRMNDIFVWEFFWNIKDWFLLDYFKAGLSDQKTDEGDKITDNFSLFMIKSRPFSRPLKWGQYKIAGGIKFFNAEFNISNSEQAESELATDDQSFLLFLTQGLSRGRHYGNLFTSLSFREKTLSEGRKKTSTTYYITPGYRFKLSEHWNLCFENFMTNTERLPIKILQFGLDEDQWEFWNSERRMYSFMFWGFNYTRKHLRIDLNMANHLSFTPPYIPVLGIGWHF
ncbi:hypothetical protein ACFL5V_03715 [Fibrobacterota bacterium]